MAAFDKISYKIVDGMVLRGILRIWRSSESTIVFTNGCFDLLHLGHLKCLAAAKDLGDKLIVGLNSDASVKRLKGEERPIKDEKTRAFLLASLEYVDGVVIFEEDTPLQLIETIQPDVLVKGGDWPVENIVGADIVFAKGGIVKSLDFGISASTSNFVDKIKTEL